MKTLTLLAISLSVIACLKGAERPKIYVVTNTDGTHVSTYDTDGKLLSPSIGCACNDVTIDDAGRVLVLINYRALSVFDGEKLVPDKMLPRGPHDLGVMSINATGGLNIVYSGMGFNSVLRRVGEHPLLIQTDMSAAHVTADRAGKLYTVSFSTLKTYDKDGNPSTPHIERSGIGGARGVAVGPDGTIFVANFTNVTAYTPEGEKKPLTIMNRNWQGGLDPTSALAVDSQGRIYVAYGEYLIVYNPDGTKAGPPIKTLRGIIAIAVR